MLRVVCEVFAASSERLPPGIDELFRFGVEELSNLIECIVEALKVRSCDVWFFESFWNFFKCFQRRRIRPETIVYSSLVVWLEGVVDVLGFVNGVKRLRVWTLQHCLLGDNRLRKRSLGFYYVPRRRIRFLSFILHLFYLRHHFEVVLWCLLVFLLAPQFRLALLNPKLRTSFLKRIIAFFLRKGPLPLCVRQRCFLSTLKVLPHNLYLGREVFKFFNFHP